MEAFISGAWRSVGRAEILIGGQWRRLTRAEAYVGGQWRTIARFVQPFSISVSPPAVEGFASPLKPTTQTIDTNFVTATPTGGLAPYTYAWSGGNFPTSATNNFTKIVPANSTVTQTYDVTVTDALGSTANASVEATFFNESQTG
jgi:hypothetical protein